MAALNFIHFIPNTSLIIVGIIALVMIGGGVAHLTSADYFAALVPPFLPARLVVIAAGLFQIALGLAVLWPKTRSWAALAFALLCLAYTPLHLWDFFRADPVFAPPFAATARVAIQVFFIWIGFVLWRRNSTGPAASN